MLDGFLEIIKKIAVFYITAVFLINLVNDEKYKKYISRFVGMIVIIMIIRPVSELLNFDGDFRGFLISNENTLELNRLRSEITLLGNEKIDMLITEFNKEASKNIQAKLDEYDVKLIELRTEINLSEGEHYGELKGLYIIISGNSANQNFSGEYSLDGNANNDIVIMELKKYIVNVYKLEKDNIYISRGGTYEAK